MQSDRSPVPSPNYRISELVVEMKATCIVSCNVSVICWSLTTDVTAKFIVLPGYDHVCPLYLSFLLCIQREVIWLQSFPSDSLPVSLEHSESKLKTNSDPLIRVIVGTKVGLSHNMIIGYLMCKLTSYYSASSQEDGTEVHHHHRDWYLKFP